MAYSTAPLYLPRLIPEGAELYNALSMRARRFCLRPSGTGASYPQIEAELLAATPVFKPAAALDFTINGTPWRLILDSLAILRAHPLLREPEFAAYRLEDLPQALLTAAAKALAAPLAAKAGELLGASVECADFAVGSSVSADSGPVLVGFSLALPTAPGMPPSVRLCAGLTALDAGAVDALKHCLAALPRSCAGFLAQSSGFIPFTLSIVGGSAALSEQEYAELEVGDILLPAAWLPNANRAELEVRSSGRLFARFPAHYSSDSVVAAEAAAGVDIQEESSMKNADEITVRLTFELENREITLGELKSLEPGWTFKLNTDPAEPVTVRANGRPVARGRLVDIGGSIGVQLIEQLGSAAEAGQ